ncbi:hypothetical protein E2L08_01785 [Palleronia sediminis]|uniref:Uncharacterized protein n=1 Tax=Palleronia sediminis TaxID=2547833 RepID=A0A4R6ALJ6_9RHOB|nr:hypothetical protein [Palleronia sediminis]TDL84222.1 hypothetical protein E2L08_01785 [Palleronia sediminis]
MTRIEAMSAMERRAILAMRLWCAGGVHRDEMDADFARLGPEAGRRTARAFRDLVTILAEMGRRPLMTHAPGCACVGSDEAIFAHFVAQSATGERDEALLIASLLMRLDMAPLAVSLAQQVGLALLRGPADLRTEPAAPRPRTARLH